jgi:heme/copper-type cytochrome/quinol oxidase subunit 3
MSTLEHHADAGHSPESHHLPPELVAHQQRRAMLLFILADAVFFACMIFSYFYLRSLNVNGGWLPGTPTAATWLIWLIAGVTVLSALAYRSGELGIRAGSKSRFQTGTLVALLLLLTSIGLTFYQMHSWPIMMSDGSYASNFIVMTATQLVHLFLVLFIGIGIWSRGGKGKFDNGNDNHVTLVGYYWYWVALAGVLGALTSFFV